MLEGPNHNDSTSCGLQAITPHTPQEHPNLQSGVQIPSLVTVIFLDNTFTNCYHECEVFYFPIYGTLVSLMYIHTLFNNVSYKQKI